MADNLFDNPDDKLIRQSSILIGQILPLLDELFKNQPQIISTAREAIQAMPDDQLRSFLVHLNSPDGQVHLQSLRNTIDEILDSWPP